MTTHSTALHSHNEYGVGSGGVLVHVGTPGPREEEGGTGVHVLTQERGRRARHAYPTFLFSPPTDITCSISLTLLATNDDKSCKEHPLVS